MTSTTTAVAPATSATGQVTASGFQLSLLPADPRVEMPVRIARQGTLEYLHLIGATEDLSNTVLLVVSELVTNAVRYGEGQPVGLKVMHLAGELRIAVTDGNHTPAKLQAAGVDDESGRGLLLVSAVSKEWGVGDDGMTTWCVLTTTEVNT
ncbi:ATP-binding protein [Streptomyces sp. MBT33]|uniref:ATP-binding protein n=1 Tax=Streptomyces sp. MBT33 TaxID=1488363 RepID=UPI00190CA43C|nr:ATP-binding protein [Streptomyces sp. MBT33]MBK3639482.1 ATP-binding protein [Streptomyces sp. MBT33]